MTDLEIQIEQWFKSPLTGAFYGVIMGLYDEWNNQSNSIQALRASDIERGILIGRLEMLDYILNQITVDDIAKEVDDNAHRPE